MSGLAETVEMSILNATGLVWSCLCVIRLTKDVNMVYYWASVDMCVFVSGLTNDFNILF